tara:strand:+ start:334 stop:477 length:144 start_codon:yes stop_codon:yes gene_type:complete
MKNIDEPKVIQKVEIIEPRMGLKIILVIIIAGKVSGKNETYITYNKK